VNGQEEKIGYATIKNGEIVTSFTPYQPKAFAVKLASKPSGVESPKYSSLKLNYNLDGISTDDNRKDGDVDGRGNSLAGELLPDTVWFQGVPLLTGPKGPGR